MSVGPTWPTVVPGDPTEVGLLTTTLGEQAVKKKIRANRSPAIIRDRPFHRGEVSMDIGTYHLLKNRLCYGTNYNHVYRYNT